MADIWSTGIILYAILFGRYPFHAQEREYARRIVDAAYVIPADVPVSPVCLDLVRRILVADPAKRLSMEGIKRHPWFLKDLPPGALDMNDFYLQAPPFLNQVQPLPDPIAPRLSGTGPSAHECSALEVSCLRCMIGYSIDLQRLPDMSRAAA